MCHLGEVDPLRETVQRRLPSAADALFALRPLASQMRWSVAEQHRERDGDLDEALSFVMLHIADAMGE